MINQHQSGNTGLVAVGGGQRDRAPVAVTDQDVWAGIKSCQQLTQIARQMLQGAGGRVWVAAPQIGPVIDDCREMLRYQRRHQAPFRAGSPQTRLEHHRRTRTAPGAHVVQCPPIGQTQHRACTQSVCHLRPFVSQNDARYLLTFLLRRDPATDDYTPTGYMHKVVQAIFAGTVEPLRPRNWPIS
ncbi:Uncharacterised protein [Mycobacteroides abscessus subsp. abscessus]|nr:Uncharacterised protein [Mycobacteroides abscessus subsp. abscessus]